jgi:hypothetical protein
MTAPQARRITRDDLESKFRELEGGVEETKESAQSSIVTVGAILLVIVIAIAFLSGRRKGTRRSTVVEVRRL